MTTYWTRCDTLLPQTDKRVLVYHNRGKYVDICKIDPNRIQDGLTLYWTTEQFLSDEYAVFNNVLIDSEDMWCDIPYPESTEVCVYDNKEVYDNCIVEIWSNENNMSIGWWKNERDN